MLALAAGPAAAQVVGDCEGLADIANVAEPWAANTRLEHGLRLVRLDTADGGLGSQHLAILTGIGEEMGGGCVLFSRGGDAGSYFGWGAIDFAAITVEPAGGSAVIGVPVSQYDPDADRRETHLFRLRVSLRGASAEVLE